MDIASLVKLAALISIFCVVVSIGLRARPGETLALLRNPTLALRRNPTLALRAMPAAIGIGTLLAVVAIAVFGLAVGHLLGGPNEGNHGALAVATAARHPGVAIGLAAVSFPG